MAMIHLPPDFKDLLRLLEEHKVKYLLIGGYAVGFHGNPRATGDMDVWVSTDEENTAKLFLALKQFGIDPGELPTNFFQDKKNMLRMGVPPLRIEILANISGVDFEQCYKKRLITPIDELTVSMIDLKSLRKNKAASGRKKDLADLDELKRFNA